MTTALPGCVLTATEIAEVQQLYASLGTQFSASAELRGERAYVDISGEKGAIKTALDDMIPREADCCAHIQFEMSEAEDGYRVILSVPDSPEIARAALRVAVPTFFPYASLPGLEHEAPLPTTSRAELKARLDRQESLALVEALPEMYYRKVHLPGALNLPLDAGSERIAALLPNKAQAIVVYCANLACKNSAILATRLIALGYTDVREYSEGKQDWIDAGLPTETRARR